jgi:hypothetical protein
MDQPAQVDNQSCFEDYVRMVKHLRGDNNFIDRPEFYVSYEKVQKKNYFENQALCIYPQWDKPWGIHKKGKNFPVMVVKKFLLDKGYDVFPSGEKENGYGLIRYRKSRQKYPAYPVLLKLFGENIASVISDAADNDIIGGDPDIFACKKPAPSAFFIEVKEDDHLNENQMKLFPIIEKYLCPVLLIRVKEKGCRA